MRTIRRWAAPVALVPFILVFLSDSTTSNGQSDSQPAADSYLQPIAPGDIPATVTTYYSLSNYLDNGGSLGPPVPFLQDTNATVYLLDANQMIVLVDDTGGTITNDETALDALASLLQPQDAFSARVLGGSMAMDSSDLNPGDGSDTNSGVGYSPMFEGYSFDTNTALWLQITNVFDSLAYLNLYNATDQVYAIWGTTNLPNDWSVQSEVWPTNSQVMPFTVPTLNQPNLFLLAEDWTGVTENGDTVPDWWFWKYYGTTDLSDTNLDSNGRTLLHDYTNGIDPNVISFLILVTNRYVNVTSVPVRLLLTGGIPFYYSIEENSNFMATSSNWIPFVSSNITVTFSQTEGPHELWIGLRGLPPDATQTWVQTRLILDTNPPVITVTNPAEGTTVSQPILQIQGYVNKELRAISFDITNAAGVLTNQTGYITGEVYDTNAAAFTTNCFQLYDVPVTNGANTIAIHATDLAGNFSTTNLTVTLDYSSDTTPPVLQVVWPQDGAKIAGNNFTLQAHIDDTMASVIATITDSGQNANTVSATVQRNGNVWLQNLPLSPGPNTLTITATDPAGNVSTTALNVIGNTNVNVSMLPISSGQLNQSSVSVTGAVNVAGDTVIANGITAAVDGSGNWQADGVPVSASGVASVEVDVYDSSSDLLASQTFNQPQPVVPKVVLDMDQEDYLVHDWLGNYLQQDCWLYEVSRDDFQWAEGVGGAHYQTDQTDDGYCSDGVIETDLRPTYYAGDDLSWTKTYLDPSEHPFYADIVDPWAWDGHSTGAFVWNARRKLVLDTGGEGQVGAVQTYLVRASTYELGYFYNGTMPLPPEWMEINGEPLVNTGITNAADGAVWGETLVQAPAGASVSVTPVATQVHTNFLYNPSVQVLPALKIVDLNSGEDVSAPGQTNIVGVGQEMRLACQLTTTNFSIQSFQWTIPGNAISNYVVAVNTNSAIVVTNFPLNNSNVVFYWVDGATNRIVQCSATINGKTANVQAAYDVIRPTVDFNGSIHDAVAVDTNYAYGGGKVWLHFGGSLNNGVTNNGIYFTATNANVFGFEQIDSYSFDVVQVLLSEAVTETYSGGTTTNLFSANALDNFYPAQGMGDGNGTVFSDAPGIGNFPTNLVQAGLSHSFRTVIMFQSFPPSIPVPIREIDWNWSGSAAITNGQWALTSSNAAITINNQDTTAFPQWTNITFSGQP